MKRFPVPGSVALVLPLAFCGLLTTQSVPAYAASWKLPAHLPEFLLFSAQGYLGVDLGSVDAERANALHLKDTHAAEVVMVDHDAPAAKSGVKVHDVILLLNGRPFDNVNQLRRSLHEMAPGRSVTLLVSRDGAPVSMTVQLCNRAELQHNVLALTSCCASTSFAGRRIGLCGELSVRPFGLFGCHVAARTLHWRGSQPGPSAIGRLFRRTERYGLAGGKCVWPEPRSPGWPQGRRCCRKGRSQTNDQPQRLGQSDAYSPRQARAADGHAR